MVSKTNFVTEELSLLTSSICKARCKLEERVEREKGKLWFKIMCLNILISNYMPENIYMYGDTAIYTYNCGCTFVCLCTCINTGDLFEKLVLWNFWWCLHRKKLCTNCCTSVLQELCSVSAVKKPVLFSEDLSYRHLKLVKSKETREIFTCMRTVGSGSLYSANLWTCTVLVCKYMRVHKLFKRKLPACQ